MQLTDVQATANQVTKSPSELSLLVILVKITKAALHQKTIVSRIITCEECYNKPTNLMPLLLYDWKSNCSSKAFESTSRGSYYRYGFKCANDSFHCYWANQNIVCADLPVKAGEFRLLCLKPNSDLSQPPVANLYTQTISSSENCYDAISYHWGDPAEVCTITINGVGLLVNRTLQTVLQYLRHTTLDRILWIDGICINQEDIHERSQQVAAMGNIYSCANWVRIWLGEATADTRAAMDLVSAAMEPHHQYYEVVKSVRSDQYGSSALTKLLHRSYWQRMWIFQEIILAKRAMVHCGSFEATWSAFCAMDKVMADQQHWVDIPMRESWVHDLRKAFFGIAQFCMKRENPTSIDDVLYPTRNLKSTDPRDKLYALMGVCEMSESLEFVPDYARAVRHVYTDFTRGMIEREKDLSSILTAGLWNHLNGRDISLPSWVPDYRGIHGVNIRYLAASYLKHFDATKGSAGLALFLPDQHEELTRLKVRGIFLDKVDTSVLLNKDDEVQQTIKNLIDDQSHGQSSNPTTFSLKSVFRSIIFDDLRFSLRSDPDRPARLALGFAHDLMETTDPPPHSQTSETISHSIKLFLSSFPYRLERYRQTTLYKIYSTYNVKNPGQLSVYREEYLARIMDTSQGTTPSIFSTYRSLVGKGLETVASGDRVAVIFGCRIPVVLRSYRGFYYQLVGPCYVDGLMQGEALKDPGGFPAAFEQDIILV